VEVVDEPRPRRQQRREHAQRHRVKRRADENRRRRRRADERADVEQKAHQEKSNRQVHQDGMQWMTERFSLEQLLEHSHDSAGGTWAWPSLATRRHLSLDMRPTPVPYS